eukprot:jgi/Ulvmu1/3907/UM018_0129.1
MWLFQRKGKPDLPGPERASSSRDNPVFNSEQAELDSDVNQKYRPSLSGQPSSIAGSPAGSFFALDACSHPGAPRPPSHAASTRWINEVDTILIEIAKLGAANPGPGLNQLQPRTLQTPRRPLNASYYTQAAAESCLSESVATPEKDARGATLSDTALVATTMAHLEELRATLAAAAMPDSRRSSDGGRGDRLDSLMGTRLWLPAALAAAGAPADTPGSPTGDASRAAAQEQREEWLSAAPGAGPRFRSPGELEAARRLREATLASGRAPTGTALEKILGRYAMEEREERASRVTASSCSSGTSLELPALDSRVAADAAMVAQRVGDGDMDRVFAAMHDGGLDRDSEGQSTLPFSINGASSIGSVLPSLSGEGPGAGSATTQQSNSVEASASVPHAARPADKPGSAAAPDAAAAGKPKIPSPPPNGITAMSGRAAAAKPAGDTAGKAPTAKEASGKRDAEKQPSAADEPGEKKKQGEREDEGAQEYASQGESIQPQKPLASMFSAAGGSTLADTAALPTLAELQGRALGNRPSAGTSSGGRTADGMQEAASRAVEGAPPSRSPPPGGKPPLSPGRMGPLPQVREADIHTGNAYMAVHGVIHDTMSSSMLSGMLSGPVSCNESVAPTPREDSTPPTAAPAPARTPSPPLARPASPPVMRPASPQQQHTAPLWPMAAYTGEESVLSIDGDDAEEDPGGDADAESMAMGPRSYGSLATGGTGMPASSMGGFSGMPDASAMSVDTGHLDDEALLLDPLNPLSQRSRTSSATERPPRPPQTLPRSITPTSMRTSVVDATDADSIALSSTAGSPHAAHHRHRRSLSASDGGGFDSAVLANAIDSGALPGEDDSATLGSVCGSGSAALAGTGVESSIGGGITQYAGISQYGSDTSMMPGGGGTFTGTQGSQHGHAAHGGASSMMPGGGLSQYASDSGMLGSSMFPAAGALGLADSGALPGETSLRSNGGTDSASLTTLDAAANGGLSQYMSDSAALSTGFGASSMAFDSASLPIGDAQPGQAHPSPRQMPRLSRDGTDGELPVAQVTVESGGLRISEQVMAPLAAVEEGDEEVEGETVSMSIAAQSSILGTSAITLAGAAAPPSQAGTSGDVRGVSGAIGAAAGPAARVDSASGPVFGTEAETSVMSTMQETMDESLMAAMVNGARSGPLSSKLCSLSDISKPLQRTQHGPVGSGALDAILEMAANNTASHEDVSGFPVDTAFDCDASLFVDGPAAGESLISDAGASVPVRSMTHHSSSTPSGPSAARMSAHSSTLDSALHATAGHHGTVASALDGVLSASDVEGGDGPLSPVSSAATSPQQRLQPHFVTSPGAEGASGGVSALSLPSSSRRAYGGYGAWHGAETSAKLSLSTIGGTSGLPRSPRSSATAAATAAFAVAAASAAGNSAAGHSANGNSATGISAAMSAVAAGGGSTASFHPVADGTSFSSSKGYSARPPLSGNPTSEDAYATPLTSTIVSPRSRRTTDLYLPTSPSFATESGAVDHRSQGRSGGSPASSIAQSCATADSRLSGMDADISGGIFDSQGDTEMIGAFGPSVFKPAPEAKAAPPITHSMPLPPSQEESVVAPEIAAAADVAAAAAAVAAATRATAAALEDAARAAERPAASPAHIVKGSVTAASPQHLTSMSGGVGGHMSTGGFHTQSASTLASLPDIGPTEPVGEIMDTSSSFFERAAAAAQAMVSPIRNALSGDTKPSPSRSAAAAARSNGGVTVHDRHAEHAAEGALDSLPLPSTPSLKLNGNSSALNPGTTSSLVPPAVVTSSAPANITRYGGRQRQNPHGHGGSAGQSTTVASDSGSFVSANSAEGAPLVPGMPRASTSMSDMGTDAGPASLPGLPIATPASSGASPARPPAGRSGGSAAAAVLRRNVSGSSHSVHDTGSSAASRGSAPGPPAHSRSTSLTARLRTAESGAVSSSSLASALLPAAHGPMHVLGRRDDGVSAFLNGTSATVIESPDRDSVSRVGTVPEEDSEASTQEQAEAAAAASSRLIGSIARFAASSRGLLGSSTARVTRPSTQPAGRHSPAATAPVRSGTRPHSAAVADSSEASPQHTSPQHASPQEVSPQLTGDLAPSAASQTSAVSPQVEAGSQQPLLTKSADQLTKADQSKADQLSQLLSGPVAARDSEEGIVQDRRARRATSSRSNVYTPDTAALHVSGGRRKSGKASAAGDSSASSILSSSKQGTGTSWRTAPDHTSSSSTRHGRSSRIRSRKGGDSAAVGMHRSMGTTGHVSLAEEGPDSPRVKFICCMSPLRMPKRLKAWTTASEDASVCSAPR